MSGTPDYTVLSRRPPFNGISSANATAKDYAGATEAVNVRFSLSDEDKQAAIERRPGWRKLGDFAEEFLDFAEFREPSSENTTAFYSYGAYLLGPNTHKVFHPVKYGLYNPNRKAVNVRRNEDGTAVVTVGSTSSTVSSFSALVTALSSSGITSVAYTSAVAASVHTRLSLSETEAASSIDLDSIDDYAGNDAYFSLVGRMCIPMVTTIGLPTSSTKRYSAGRFPRAAFKSKYGTALSFGYAISKSTSVQSEFNDFRGAVLSNGHTFERVGSSLGLVSATGSAGASYSEFAMQLQVRDLVLRTDLSLDPDASITYYGAMGERKSCSTGQAASATYQLAVYGNSAVEEDTLYAGLATRFSLKAAGSYFRLTYQTVDSGTGSRDTNDVAGGANVNHPIWYDNSGLSYSYVMPTRGSGNGYLALSNTGSVTDGAPAGLGCRLIVWKTKSFATAAEAAAAPLYRVDETYTQVNNNTHAAISVTVADTDLTEISLPRAIEPENGSLNVGVTCGCFHQTRSVLGTTDGRLLYSLPDEPVNFAPSTNSLQLEGVPLGLVSINSSMYVFTTTGIYVVQGALGTLESSLIKLSNTVLSGKTAYAQSQCCGMGNSVAFVSDEGKLCVIDGDTIKEVPNYNLAVPPPVRGTDVVFQDGTNESRLIQDDISGIRMAYCPHDGLAIGRIGATEIDVLDSRFRWSKYTLPGSLRDVQALAGRMSVLVAISSGSALYMLDDACTTDAGTAISMRYASQWEDLEDPRTEKTFAKLSVDLAEGASQNTTLTVRTEYDYLPGKLGTSKSASLRVGQGWGNQAWGRTPWGDKNQTNVVVPLSNEKHRAMRVIFESTKNLAISGWSIEAIATGAHAKSNT